MSILSEFFGNLWIDCCSVFTPDFGQVFIFSNGYWKDHHIVIKLEYENNCERKKELLNCH